MKRGQELRIEHGKFFTVEFVAEPPGSFFVHVNKMQTYSDRGWRLGDQHKRGAVGIVMRSGEIKIRRLIVAARATGESASGKTDDSRGAENTTGDIAGTAQPRPIDQAGPASRGPQGWIPLFNGKNLSGWKNSVPDNGSGWGVNSDGILEGHGGGEAGKGAMLVSERRNYTNFALRVRLCFPQNSGGRIVIRQTGADDSMRGYQIQAFGSGEYPIGRIGRLIDPPPSMGIKTEPIPFPDDQWKTIEIIVDKNEITTLMVGGDLLDHQVDPDATYTAGGIAVRCWWNSQIQIKEILIRELLDDPVPKKSARQSTTRGRSKVKGKQASHDSATTKAADALQPGTVWTGTHFLKTADNPEPLAIPASLAVLERAGEIFKARYEVGAHIRDIRGTIKDGRITWLARDVQVIKGHQGPDTQGTIQGEEISLTLSGVRPSDGTLTSGTIKLSLKK